MPATAASHASTMSAVPTRSDSHVFAHLQEAEEAALLSISTSLYFKKGAVLLQPGVHSENLFVIKKGRVRIEQQIGDAFRTIAYLGQRDVLDLISFVANVPSQFRFVADADLVCVHAISKGTLGQLLYDNPLFSMHFHRSLGYLLAKQLHASYLRFGALMDAAKRQRGAEPDSRQDLPDKRVKVRAAIEQMPRVARDLTTHWGTPYIHEYLNDLIVNPRDINRQGFPLEVFSEIMFLYNLISEEGSGKDQANL